MNRAGGRETIIQQRQAEGITKEQEESKEWKKSSNGLRMRVYLPFDQIRMKRKYLFIRLKEGNEHTAS